MSTDAFAGKVALVTGAGSGIGRAAARQLAGQGTPRVVFAEIDGVAAEAATAGSERSSAVKLDVADPHLVDETVTAIVRQHGRLDVVIHAAGVDDAAAKQLVADALVSGQPPELIAGLSDEAWRRIISINLDGTFYVLRAAVRQMTAQRSGSVVLVGSSSALDAPSILPHYAAAKAGVHALGQAVAKEVIAHNVRVNILAPGPTDTGMAARTPEALKKAVLGSAVGGYATPDEMARLALFLASAQSVNVVGAVLLANGGRFTV